MSVDGPGQANQAVQQLGAVKGEYAPEVARPPRGVPALVTG